MLFFVQSPDIPNVIDPVRQPYSRTYWLPKCFFIPYPAKKRDNAFISCLLILQSHFFRTPDHFVSDGCGRRGGGVGGGGRGINYLVICLGIAQFPK